MKIFTKGREKTASAMMTESLIGVILSVMIILTSLVIVRQLSNKNDKYEASFQNLVTELRTFAEESEVGETGNFFLRMDDEATILVYNPVGLLPNGRFDNGAINIVRQDYLRYYFTRPPACQDTELCVCLCTHTNDKKLEDSTYPTQTKVDTAKVNPYQWIPNKGVEKYQTFATANDQNAREMTCGELHCSGIENTELHWPTLQRYYLSAEETASNAFAIENGFLISREDYFVDLFAELTTTTNHASGAGVSTNIDQQIHFIPENYPLYFTKTSQGKLLICGSSSCFGEVEEHIAIQESSQIQQRKKQERTILQTLITESDCFSYTGLYVPQPPYFLDAIDKNFFTQEQFNTCLQAHGITAPYKVELTIENPNAKIPELPYTVYATFQTDTWTQESGQIEEAVIIKTSTKTDEEQNGWLVLYY